MIKTLGIDAPLETLNAIEASGLTCKWDGEFLNVTVDGENYDDLLKLAKALSGCKQYSVRCLKVEFDGEVPITEEMVKEFYDYQNNKGLHKDSHGSEKDS